MAVTQYTPISPVGKCKTCGKEFGQIIGRGKWRTYCSQACVPPKPAPTKLCELDGCGNIARSNANKYCEKHYYQVRRNGRIGTLVEMTRYDSCQHCGASTGGNKYCSERCSARHRRGLPVTVDCASCGESFVAVNKKVTCSPECASRHVRKVRRERYARLMRDDPAYKEKVRKAEYRRKSLKREAFVEDVGREEVMQMSRWVCHICGEKIPKSAKWPNPMFGTVDHVLPLACGGKHSYANCKAAHLRCNCRKSDTPLGQLSLCFAV